MATFALNTWKIWDSFLLVFMMDESCLGKTTIGALDSWSVYHSVTGINETKMRILSGSEDSGPKIESGSSK